MGKNFNQMKEIDTEKLKDILLDTGKSLQEISRMIGAGDSYFSQILRSGRMSDRFVRATCNKLRISEGSFVIGASDEDNIFVTDLSTASDAQSPTEIDCLLRTIADSIYDYLGSRKGNDI